MGKRPFQRQNIGKVLQFLSFFGPWPGDKSNILFLRVATDKDFTSVLICLRKGFRITVDFILLWPRQFASLLGTWQLYSRFDSPIVKKANHIGCLQMKFANTLRTSKATSQVMNSI